MTSIVGTVRMSMRIDVEERRSATRCITPSAPPGSGVARLRSEGEVYKYLKQVTNLSSPASYRALVRFAGWRKGHVPQARRTVHGALRTAGASPEATGSSTETPTPSATVPSVGA